MAGAGKLRNPDLDLPADFEANRAENYARLRKPLDPGRFTGELREELDAEPSALNDALGGKGLAWLKIAERRNAGTIHLTPLDAAPEPRNLRRLKTAIRARWGVVPLMDMLTETCLRTGCLSVFTPAGTQNHLDPQVLFERLLLLIYAYGTGTGIRAAAAGDHPHTEDDLRYARRRYLTVEACRQAARIIANATFAARQAALWGEGTTAVASDSTHFSAFDQNIFTEWHSRYRRAKRGVLIYWTVDTAGSMAVHSQLISCSASEVHATVEGAMRHGTDMEVEQNFVDSHGACCPASSPPGPCQPPPASRRRPAPPARHAFEAPVPAKRPPRPRTSEGPRTREPGATPGSLPCPHAGRPHSKIIHLPVDNVRRSTRGFGSEDSPGGLGNPPGTSGALPARQPSPWRSRRSQPRLAAR